MPRIDPGKTVAIVIGVSEFRDRSFINASPIKNNVTKIKELLQDKDILGLDEKKILVLDKNERHDEILDRIEDFLEQDFVDTLIFYFAGHGYKTDKGDFYLVTNNSNIRHLNISAIPWDSLKEIFEKGSGIQQRIYILDTCHSGAATLGDSEEVLDIEDGSALLAAAKADRKAYFNENDQYTYFTDAFINILENGIPNYEEPDLPIRPIFQQLDKNLKDKKIEVTIKSTHKIDDVSIFRNRGFDKAELLVKQAKDYFEQGNYSEAIRHYRYAISEYYLSKTISKNKKKIKQIEKDIDVTRIYLKAQEKFLHGTDKEKEKEPVKHQSQEIEEVIDQSVSSIEADTGETVTEEIGHVKPVKKKKVQNKVKKQQKLKKYHKEEDKTQTQARLNQKVETVPVLEKNSELLRWPQQVPQVKPFLAGGNFGIIWYNDKFGWFADLISGQTYKVVRIGNQIWMLKNLKVTKYNDGTDIPNVTDNDQWAKISTGAYCWYRNDKNNSETYGALYNWFAIETGKLCPTGWHVPSDSEWLELTNFLGGEDVAGGKLKESGTTHWKSPNKGANNESSFTALPGGSRYCDGSFNYIGDHGFWWSSIEDSSTHAWYRFMSFDQGLMRSYYNKTGGFSIRCIKDN